MLVPIVKPPQHVLKLLVDCLAGRLNFKHRLLKMAHKIHFVRRLRYHKQPKVCFQVGYPSSTIHLRGQGFYHISPLYLKRFLQSLTSLLNFPTYSSLLTLLIYPPFILNQSPLYAVCFLKALPNNQISCCILTL